MREIPCPEDVEDDKEDETNDLYMQCEAHHPLAHYAIREIID